MGVANRDVHKMKTGVGTDRSTVVSGNIRGAGSLGRGLENAAIRRPRSTRGSAGLVKKLAENFLLTGRLNGVCGATKIQSAPDFNGSTAVDVGFQAERGERANEVRGVRHSVGDAKVQVGCHATEGAIKMVVPVGGDSSGAEAVARAAGRDRAPNRRNIVDGGIAEGKTQIGVCIADAVCGVIHRSRRRS